MPRLLAFRLKRHLLFAGGFRQISSAEPSTNCNAPFDMSATFAGTPDGSDSFQHVFSTLSSSSDPDLQQLMTSITEPVETGRQAPHAQPLAWCTQVLAIKYS